MAYVKAFHLLFVFIWVGNLMALTRFMGYHVKEDANTQMRLAALYKRMYQFVGLPSMIFALLLGAVLIHRVNQEDGLGWFMIKISCAIGLVVCDVACGHYINALNLKSEHGKGVRYKILHGVTGLLLIGILTSVYILR